MVCTQTNNQSQDTHKTVLPTHTHTLTYMYTCTHTHTQKHTCIHVRMHTHTHRNIHVYMYACTHTHTQKHVFFACGNTIVCTLLHIYIYNWKCSYWSCIVTTCTHVIGRYIGSPHAMCILLYSGTYEQFPCYSVERNLILNTSHRDFHIWVVSLYKESCNNKPMYGYMLPNLSPSPNLYKVFTITM